MLFTPFFYPGVAFTCVCVTAPSERQKRRKKEREKEDEKVQGGMGEEGSNEKAGHGRKILEKLVLLETLKVFKRRVRKRKTRAANEKKSGRAFFLGCSISKGVSNVPNGTGNLSFYYYFFYGLRLRVQGMRSSGSMKPMISKGKSGQTGYFSGSITRL